MKPFPINTKGHCFLCINEIGRITRHKTQSIRILCRYFNIKVESFLNISSGEGEAAQEKLDVRVTLCEKCDKIAARLTTVYKLLETLEMEMDYLVGAVHNSILEVEGNSKMKEKYMKMMSENVTSNIQPEAVDNLRRAIWNECVYHSANVLPKVSIKALPVIRIEPDLDEEEIFFTPETSPQIPQQDETRSLFGSPIIASTPLSQHTKVKRVSNELGMEPFGSPIPAKRGRKPRKRGAVKPYKLRGGVEKENVSRQKSTRANLKPELSTITESEKAQLDQNSNAGLETQKNQGKKPSKKSTDAMNGRIKDVYRCKFCKTILPTRIYFELHQNSCHLNPEVRKRISKAVYADISE